MSLMEKLKDQMIE
jgi:hypothetical protein